MSDFPRRLAVDGWRDVRPPRFIETMVQQRVSIREAHDAFDRYYCIALLQANDGNHSRAARAGGMHRNTLIYKLQRIIQAALTGGGKVA